MILDEIAFEIPWKKVLSRLNFNNKKTKITSNVENLIDDMIDECRILANPAASLEHFDITIVEPDAVHLAETRFAIEGKYTAKHLDECKRVTLMVCTIGEECTVKVGELLAAREVSKAAVLDAVASEAVEAVANKVTEVVAQQAHVAGLKLTSRYSPGYGDWPLAAQGQMFDLLDAKRIGVFLNEYSFMQPEKSISACVGWK